MIKGITIILFFAAIHEIGADFTCPSDFLSGTGLYPNPDNCNSFIQCATNPDGSGRPYVMPCAPGLQWNDNKKVCDWPYSSTCNKVVSTTSRQTNSPSTTTTTTTTTTKAPRPNTPDFTCPREDIANTGCMGPKDCLYPNPENCNTFLQCTVNPDGSGTPVVMPCPAGLEWNDNDKICDWPSSSTCNKVVSTTTSRPTRSTRPTRHTPLTPTVPSTISTTQTPKEPSTAAPSRHTQMTPTTPMKPTTTTPTTKHTQKTPTTPTTEPSTAQTTTDEPSTPVETTPSPTTKVTTTESTTINEDESTPTPADTTTGAVSDSNSSEQTTTEQTLTSTLSVCSPDDDDNDSDLDLADICGTACNDTRTVAHPKDNNKYVICSSTNSVQKCGEGLLYSTAKVTCTYSGLVDSN